MDNGEIHLDPVGTTMAHQHQTAVLSIAPGSTDFSIASPPETTTTETSFTMSKRGSNVKERERKTREDGKQAHQRGKTLER